MGHQLDPLARHAVAGPLDLRPQGQDHLRDEVEAEIIGRRRAGLVEHRPRRGA